MQRDLGALRDRGAPGHSVKLEPGGAGRASGPIARDPARCVEDLVLRTVENRGGSETSEFSSRRILWLNIGERMEVERPEARRAVSSCCDLSGQGWHGPEMRPSQCRGGRGGLGSRTCTGSHPASRAQPGVCFSRLSHQGKSPGGAIY